MMNPGGTIRKHGKALGPHGIALLAYLEANPRKATTGIKGEGGGR